MLARKMPLPNDNFYHSLEFQSEAETVAFGARVGALLRAEDTVTLSGGLGAGKTVFARAIIRRFLPQEEVPSPTFTLVQTYQTASLPIWHVDLYRVKERREVRELGLDEALENGALIVEWPDRMGELLSPDRLDVILSTKDDEESARTAQFIGRGSWAERLRDLVKDTHA